MWKKKDIMSKDISKKILKVIFPETLIILTPGMTSVESQKKKFRQGTRADILALLWTLFTESSR
jgi:hypothetical protein